MKGGGALRRARRRGHPPRAEDKRPRQKKKRGRGGMSSSEWSSAAICARPRRRWCAREFAAARPRGAPWPLELTSIRSWAARKPLVARARLSRLLGIWWELARSCPQVEQKATEWSYPSCASRRLHHVETKRFYYTVGRLDTAVAWNSDRQHPLGLPNTDTVTNTSYGSGSNVHPVQRSLRVRSALSNRSPPIVVAGGWTSSDAKRPLSTPSRSR